MPHLKDNNKTTPVKNSIQKQMWKFLADSDIDETDLNATIKDKLSITERQLTYWKKNQGIQPTLDQLKAISKILSCTVNDLIEA